MQAHSQSSPAARDSLQAARLSATPVPAVFVERSNASPLRSIAQGVGLAHDAGNLLGALGLYCDLLSAPGVLQPEHSQYVTELRLIAQRSSCLINKLLSQSVPTANAQQSTTAVVAPPKTCLNAAATLREIAPLLTSIAGTSATVVYKAPRSIPTPNFPSETLERILVNLVRNAAQAIEHTSTPSQQGHIRVTLATIAGHLRLTVEDDGPGMPVTTAASFLSPSPLPRGAQHGLGHRIIHDLVTTSGGTLSMRVRPGRGTTICIQWSVPTTPRPEQSASTTCGNRCPGVATC